MARKRSILEELDNILPEKDKDLVLEARALHAISNALHVLKLIRENYDQEVADDLTKRFMLSIKNNNSKKFETGIRNLKESK